MGHIGKATLEHVNSNARSHFARVHPEVNSTVPHAGTAWRVFASLGSAGSVVTPADGS